MTQAVASSDAMRSLIVRMASATDDELKDIASHVAMAAYKILDAVSENPFTQPNRVLHGFSSPGLNY